MKTTLTLITAASAAVLLSACAGHHRGQIGRAHV